MEAAKAASVVFTTVVADLATSGMYGWVLSVLKVF